MLRLMTDQSLDAALERRDVTTLKMDGMTAAVLGLTDEDPPRLVYSMAGILQVLQEGGMDEGEALEYFEFNIAGAYVGEQTPLVVDDLGDAVQ